MERIIVYVKDEERPYINIAGTDIFERGEYLHVYNGTDLVAVILVNAVKIIFKSIKNGDNASICDK